MSKNPLIYKGILIQIQISCIYTRVLFCVFWIQIQSQTTSPM